MKYSSRYWVPLGLAALLILSLPWKHAGAAGNQVVLLFGGDVEWSLNYPTPSVIYPLKDTKPFGELVFGKRDVRDQVVGDWPPIPYVNKGAGKAYLESLHLKAGNDETVGESLSFPLTNPKPEYTQDYSNNMDLLNYPLKRLAPVFHAADLVFVNNEGALSDHKRQVGSNKTPEKFAKVMQESGIGIVNLANNHTFDAEERGFLDTLRVLNAAGIAHVGGGNDLNDARKPAIITKNGVKLGFISYTQFNNFGESAFASDGRPGVAPMDPFLIKEDIRKLRPQVDYVLVAIHWSTSVSKVVSPENRKLAHELIDAGADVILGHHPPHPKGVEVYKGKVIFYAPSNVLRGHTTVDSDDGYLARLTMGPKSVEKIEVLPIAGKGQPQGHSGAYDSKLFQPYVMQGASAQKLLETIRSRTAALDTTMKIEGDKGVITVSAAGK